MRHSHGFTLLEVLIAGVILFAVMTIMQKSIAIASFSSLVATRNVNVESVLPNITNLIKQQLTGSYLANKTEEKSEFLGVEYSWKATLITQKPLLKSAFEQIQLDSAEGQNGNYVKLWSVELSVSSGDKEELFQYAEVVW